LLSPIGLSFSEGESKVAIYTMTESVFRVLYPDDETARLAIERVRWPNGPVCPRCSATTRIGSQRRKDVAGYYRCNACLLTFTVRTGTLFQRSHVPLHTWLIAMFMIEHMYRKITSVQLAFELGVPQKTAWSLLDRYRRANSLGKTADNQLVPKDLLDTILAEACEMMAKVRDDSSGT
jgi:transposase-like protein